MTQEDPPKKYKMYVEATGRNGCLLLRFSLWGRTVGCCLFTDMSQCSSFLRNVLYLQGGVDALGPRVLSAGTASHASSPHKHALQPIFRCIQDTPTPTPPPTHTLTHTYMQSFLCNLKDMTQFIHGLMCYYFSL